MGEFLTPVLVLIFWTLIIWCLLYIQRIPAMKAAKIVPDSARNPDGDWKAKIPERVHYAAHNYNHLMEQPTIFYALMIYLVLTNQADSINLYLAWGYVVFRVLHSLVQVTCNKVMARFSLFAIGSVLLIIMALRAAANLF